MASSKGTRASARPRPTAKTPAKATLARKPAAKPAKASPRKPAAKATIARTSRQVGKTTASGSMLGPVPPRDQFGAEVQ